MDIMPHGSGGRKSKVRVSVGLVSPWLADGRVLPVSSCVFSLSAHPPDVSSFYKDTSSFGFTVLFFF